MHMEVCMLPKYLAVRMAAASEAVSRLHRKMAEKRKAHASTPEWKEAAREIKLLELAERVAMAAESMADNRVQGVSAVVAKHARKTAERQARCMAVPQPGALAVLGPEWAEKTLARKFEALSDELEGVSCEGDGGALPSRARRSALDASYKLPLACPLSGQRLRVPVRGVQCEHLECVDLESLRHAAPNGWKCPLVGCTGTVAPDMLRRDAFVEALLRQTEQDTCRLRLLDYTNMDADMLPAAPAASMEEDRAQALARCALLLQAASTPPRRRPIDATRSRRKSCIDVDRCPPSVAASSVVDVTDDDDSDCEVVVATAAAAAKQRFKPKARSPLGGA
eukprot:TRINITY_DN45155_c0_g1_i2.p1 TRINITY_DN45155_c0_g1~~TRINITY_DN45155_c0_g1_i2.p1  ORF type:complete len:337 (-),score=75.89 TRINITY_DN45155_c0_g1_i2:82-1092(-)